MNQRQAHHLIIDAWIAPGSRKTDYQIPMTDKNEVGVMNIVPQPFAGDDAERAKRSLTKASQDVFRTEHSPSPA